MTATNVIGADKSQEGEKGQSLHPYTYMHKYTGVCLASHTHVRVSNFRSDCGCHSANSV